MNSAAFAILFASVFVTVTVTQAENDAVISRTRRSAPFGQPFAMPRKRSSFIEDTEDKRAAYLGFPRLGRGYLALPRMGRSHAPGNDADANGGSCCTTGLKKEWVFGEGGKMSEQSVCEAESCCPDFQEVQNSRPDGTFYTMCIPVLDSRSLDANDNVVLKLRRLFRN